MESEESKTNEEIKSGPKSENTFRSFIVEVVKIVVIAAVIVVPIRFFLFQPFFVNGESMNPNFDDGDYLIIDEISYRFSAPQRGDVIVFKYPEDPVNRFIKRIVGLPGETVRVSEGEVTIVSGDRIMNLDEEYLPEDISTSGSLEVALGDDQYFVLGDNRPYSFDSRRFGPLLKKYITGKVFFRAWPLESASIIKQPSY